MKTQLLSEKCILKKMKLLGSAAWAVALQLLIYETQGNLSLLAELLKEKSSLRPTLVTVAKALYDSYHRESLVSSVTDRGSSLENSSGQGTDAVNEWQPTLGLFRETMADGLTKESTRQSLSDRLRHSKIKFLWDPNYAAAKKKPLAERNRNLQESSQSRKPKKKNQLKPSFENGHLPPIDENLPDTFNVVYRMTSLLKSTCHSE